MIVILTKYTKDSKDKIIQIQAAIWLHSPSRKLYTRRNLGPYRHTATQPHSRWTAWTDHSTLKNFFTRTRTNSPFLFAKDLDGRTPEDLTNSSSSGSLVEKHLIEMPNTCKSTQKMFKVYQLIAKYTGKGIFN